MRLPPNSGSTGRSASPGWSAIVTEHPEFGDASGRRGGPPPSNPEPTPPAAEPLPGGPVYGSLRERVRRRLGQWGPFIAWSAAVGAFVVAPALRFISPDLLPDLDLGIEWSPEIRNAIDGFRKKIAKTSEEVRLPDELLYIEGWNDVEQLFQLPDGISDTGVVLFAARPLADTDIVRTGRKADRGRYYDNLLEYNALSELLWKGRILYIDYSPRLTDHRGDTTRGYHFTLPSEEQGELIPGREDDNMLNTVWWPEIFKKLTRAHKADDEEVKNFLVWWYARTFVNQNGRPVLLDSKGIHLTRDEHGHIKSVKYNGTNAGDLLQFDRVRYAEDDQVYSKGRNANRSTEPIPKPLTIDSKLTPWTGAYQDLVVPETFLRENGTITMDLNEYGVDEELKFSWEELADSLRSHYKNRHAGELLFYRSPRTGKIILRQGWDKHVTPNDPIVKRLAKLVTQGADSKREALDDLRIFTQHVEYVSESDGVEVNRPAIATLMTGWGDCNNRTVWASSLYGAGGYDVAVAYVEGSGAKTAFTTEFPQYTFSSHLLPAVGRKHLGDSYDGLTWEYERQKWVLVETGEGRPFGSSLPEGMTVVTLEEVTD